MVFSFFKKPPQKMPERQAAKPCGQAPGSVPPNVVEEAPVSLAAPLPDLEFTNSKPLGAGAPAAKVERSAVKPAAPVRAAINPNLAKDDFDDAEFTESIVMGIDVDQDADPVQGDVEHVVVLFANGQEAAARSLLEMLIRSYPGDEGRRFWLLLLDLLQCVGDRAAFDKLALEFAETWETSPSSWRQTEQAVVMKSNGQRRLVLQGVLTAESAESVAELARLTAQGLPVVIECGKLVGCDDEVAGQLAAILREARRNGVAVVLKEIDGFLARLNERLLSAAGRESDWALLLELLQRHGTQELFEERAVDYAVAFELSPPSWESMPAPKPEADATEPADDAHYLQGDLKNCRFDELVEVLDGHELPIIDFSGVRSMDFFSAGQLVNRIAPYKAQGREILIRSPNHLVAELMAVVGLNKQARIIVPKS
jgi:anti-anti-sigma regulatory factor